MDTRSEKPVLSLAEQALFLSGRKAQRDRKVSPGIAYAKGGRPEKLPSGVIVFRFPDRSTCH